MIWSNLILVRNNLFEPEKGFQYMVKQIFINTVINFFFYKKLFQIYIYSDLKKK